MRLLITTIIIIGLLNSAKCQKAFNTENADSSNVYFQSLKIICDAYAQNGYDEVFIEENLTTKGLPKNCQGLTIKYINNTTIKKFTGKNKTLLLHRIIPLRLKDGEFFVNIIKFEVSRIKKKYKYANKGGNKLIFEYDCVEECLVYRSPNIK